MKHIFYVDDLKLILRKVKLYLWSNMSWKGPLEVKGAAGVAHRGMLDFVEDCG